MKTMNTVRAALLLAGAMSSVSAMAVTGVGAVSHDIQFGGIVAENAPKWVWSLPQPLVRIDLKAGDAQTVDDKAQWDVLQNRQPYRFLEGYMEPTIVGLAMQGLDADVRYWQDGTEVTPTLGENNATLLTLSAVGNKDTSPVSGTLSVVLQPVLLVGQVSATDTKVLTAQQLADAGVTQADVNAPEAYTNAKAKLASQQGKLGATSITYDTSTPAPAGSLADGTAVTKPMTAGYASTLTKATLAFPKASAASVSQWQSVITVQVQYK